MLYLFRIPSIYAITTITINKINTINRTNRTNRINRIRHLDMNIVIMYYHIKNNKYALKQVHAPYRNNTIYTFMRVRYKKYKNNHNLVHNINNIIYHTHLLIIYNYITTIHFTITYYLSMIIYKDKNYCIFHILIIIKLCIAINKHNARNLYKFANSIKNI